MRTRRERQGLFPKETFRLAVLYTVIKKKSLLVRLVQFKFCFEFFKKFYKKVLYTNYYTNNYYIKYQIFCKFQQKKIESDKLDQNL